MNSSNKPRTAAVIGCGKARDGKEGWAIGHCHAEGYLAADPGIRLFGVDVDAANLAAFGERFGLPTENLFRSTAELYAAVTPQIVSICTWPELHCPQVLEAAERGVKGIYCEKPLALNPGEIARMQRVCAEKGVHLAVAHQRRMEPLYRRFKEVVASGELGNEVVLEGRVGDGWDILSWTTHLFDLANYVFDAEPVSVLAGMDHSGTRRYGQAVEDNSVILLQYPGNRQALFITGPHDAGCGLFQATGPGGVMRVDGGHLRVVGSNGAWVEELFQQEPFMTPPVRDLLAAVETGAVHGCDAAECSAATAIAYAAHESARTMRAVSFPPRFEFAPLEVVQSAPKAWLPEGDIILFADSHFGSGGREGITSALRAATGREVSVIDAESSALDSPALDNAGILLIYHTQPEPDAVTKAALEQWVSGGKPLGIIHAGLGAYPQWPEYREWCGRVWSWGGAFPPSEHPWEPSRLAVTGSLPLAWREARIPTDEVFIKLAPVSDCDDLVEAEISTGRYPAAWTNRANPRIGVWVPGHREDMWSIPALREGLIALLQKISLP